LNDADGDGVCDEFEVAGCTDPEAVNYQPLATNSSDNCLFPEDFEPDCLFDFSGDDYIGTADLLIFLSNLGNSCD
jgi:hypothetical protein